MIDKVAARYGSRPSALLGFDQPWEALLIDAACYLAGAEARASALEDARRAKALVIPAIVMDGL